MKKAQPKSPPVVDRARRESVLDEAAIELNSRGVSQASLSGIAARLGVTRAALYYYVEDQEDLVFQCYRRTCEAVARRITNARKETEGAIECLEAFIDGMLSLEQPEVAAISELAFLSGEKRETIEGLLEAIFAQLARIIDGGIKSGAMRPCNTAYVARAIFGIVSWPSLMKRVSPNVQEAARQALVPVIKELLTRGVAADRSRLPDFERRPVQVGMTAMSDVFLPDHVVNAKREALLAAGSRLLNQKGIDATSLDEIALSLGVSKAVIYHNIGDKQTFVLECLSRSFRFFLGIAERMEQSQEPRLNSAASANHAICLLHLRQSGPLLFPVVGFDALPKAMAGKLQEQQQRLLAIWRRVMIAGQAEGSIRKLDADMFIVMTPALFHWLSRWHHECSDADGEEIATEVAHLWSVGLSALETRKPKSSSKKSSR